VPKVKILCNIYSTLVDKKQINKMKSRRITNTLAESIANKLCEKRYKEIEKLKTSLIALKKKEYQKWLPDNVKETFAKHPSFFTTTNIGDGTYLPVDRNISHRIFNDHPSISKGTKTKFECLEKAEIEYKAKRYKLIELIKSYKTTSKLKQGFPLAFNVIKEYKEIENPPAIKLDLITEWLTKNKNLFI
jgi:hypothetical protein